MVSRGFISFWGWDGIGWIVKCGLMGEEYRHDSRAHGGIMREWYDLITYHVRLA